jgi:dynactin complex subunit
LDAQVSNEPVISVDDAIVEKCQSENSLLKEELAALNKTVIEMKKELSSCTALHEQTFFRQYVRVLLERFKNLAATVGLYLCFLLTIMWVIVKLLNFCLLRILHRSFQLLFSL